MKSKVIYIPFGILALSLASCSSDEDIARNANPDGLLSYSISTNNQTRALHSFNANRTPDNFIVWADYTDDNEIKKYINGDQANRVEGSTTNEYQSTILRYWPDDENLGLNFYAYTDDGGKFNYNGGNPKVEDFEVESDVTKQLDLMYAVAPNMKRDTENGNVTLHFRHALSQVCFKAKNSSTNPNLKIYVNKITVSGIKGKGTYTLPKTSTNDTQTEDGSSSATSTESRWNFAATTNTTSYAVDITTVKNEQTTATGTPITSSATNLTCYEDPDGSYSNILNLIPQEASSATFTLNISLENVATLDNASYEYTDIKSFDVEIPASIAWNEGYRYIYTFDFPDGWDASNPNLHPVTFTVSTTDDFSPEDGPFQLPYVKMRNAGNDKPALYFAKTNIGAKSIDDPGLYFWWGDTKGHEAKVDDEGKIYAEFSFWEKEIENDNEINSPILTLKKSLNDLYPDYITEASEDGTLRPEYDAAHVYLGDEWRIPTKEELEWITNDANCKWTYDADKNCAKVESLTTGGIIYFPITGYFLKSNSLPDSDPTYLASEQFGFYWTSNPNEQQTNGRAFTMYINTKPKNNIRDVYFKGVGPAYDTFYGHCIRPVFTTDY